MTNGDAPDLKPRLIDQQNRVALPAEVLRTLRAKSGDYVVFVLDDGQVRLHKARWAVER